MTESEKNAECNSAVFIIRASLLIRHSCYVIPFDLIPDFIQFHEIDITESLATRIQFVLQTIESCDEFVSRTLQRSFRVELAFPCEIDDCKEQITYFVFDRSPILLQNGLF